MKIFKSSYLSVRRQGGTSSSSWQDCNIVLRGLGLNVRTGWYRRRGLCSMKDNLDLAKNNIGTYLYLSIYIYLYIYLSINNPYISINQSIIKQSINQSISIYQSTNLSIYQYINLSTILSPPPNLRDMASWRLIAAARSGAT